LTKGQADEVNKMAEEVSWDEAIASNGFVKLESDKEKVLLLKNFKLEKVEKFGKEEVEFSADVVEEDGSKVEEKKFTTTSKRLKTKLRPLVEGKAPTDEVKVSILKVGDKYDTQYSVKTL
jgi:hypothetical protein